MIAHNYQSLGDALRQLVSHFDQEGTLLHDGRNQVKQIMCGNTCLIVKRYHHFRWLKAFIYGSLRKSKACRAYENGCELLRRGVLTPEPVAYFESRRKGFLTDCFYICLPTDWKPIDCLITPSDNFDHVLAEEYALFVASLHEKGILHNDLNPGNVLYTQKDEDYSFQLIDINRMTFCSPGKLTKVQCMDNLTRFWWLSPVYRFILNRYAAARGWGEQDVEKAIRIKERHDQAWIRRKNFLSIFRHGRLAYHKSDVPE